MYLCIHLKNFIDFLLEAEILRILRKSNSLEKLDEFAKL